MRSSTSSFARARHAGALLVALGLLGPSSVTYGQEPPRPQEPRPPQGPPGAPRGGPPLDPAGVARLREELRARPTEPATLLPRLELALRLAGELLRARRQAEVDRARPPEVAERLAADAARLEAAAHEVDQVLNALLDAAASPQATPQGPQPGSGTPPGATPDPFQDRLRRAVELARALLAAGRQADLDRVLPRDLVARLESEARAGRTEAATRELDRAVAALEALLAPGARQGPDAPPPTVPPRSPGEPQPRSPTGR